MIFSCDLVNKAKTSSAVRAFLAKYDGPTNKVIDAIGAWSFEQYEFLRRQSKDAERYAETKEVDNFIQRFGTTQRTVHEMFGLLEKITWVAAEEQDAIRNMKQEMDKIDSDVSQAAKVLAHVVLADVN